jgi:peptidyl-dipeptidase Dcp
VTDEIGKHLALFYSDFYPRAGKHGGAWTTEFGEAYINPSGEEVRPFVSIVCNFTKPTDTKPSLLTFSEVTTLLHEFGHSLHAIMAEGKYPSLTGTNVARDFVELPSQIMENWASEPEYLCSWAKHYETGKPIPEDLIKKIIASRNYLSGYASVRQLTFGICDMAWHCMESLPDNFTGEKVTDFEQEAAEGTHLLPAAPGTAFCPTFSHIFAGGYAAGYYSYKWSEVLSADAFELFKEKGIFNRDVAGSFRKEILSKGNLRDANILYKAFRGRDPNEEALFRNLGMKN